MKINWKTEQRDIKDLKPNDKNPRYFTEKGISDLSKSLDKFGVADPIIINTDNKIIGGHARIKVLQMQGVKSVDVRVPDKLLTDKQAEELLIRLNANIAGDWNFDILANDFEIEDLKDWGVAIPDFDIPEVRDKIENLTKGLNIHKRNPLYAISFYGANNANLKEFKANKENIKILADSMSDFINYFFKVKNDMAIITTPIRRSKNSLFAFADELCKEISKTTKIPYIKEVFKAKNNQRFGDDFEIIKNIKQNFIILIDDILTTGQTAIRCNINKNIIHLIAIWNG